MTYNFRKILSMMFFGVVVTACSYPENAEWSYGHDDDADSAGTVVSVAFLKSHYRGYPYTVVENMFIRGWVVSSDRSGNYYKTLAVEDDSAAIEIKLDSESLFETYFVGSVVEVACNGLTLGSYGGVVQLGAASDSGYETDYITAKDIARTVRIVGQLDHAPVPEILAVDGVSDSHIGRLVAFENVQFVDAADGNMTWCDADPDSSVGYRDTDRTITDRFGHKLLVRTSRYAGFASWRLPAGSGRIEGIMSCFGGNFQLKVVSPEILYDDMSEPRFAELP